MKAYVLVLNRYRQQLLTFAVRCSILSCDQMLVHVDVEEDSENEERRDIRNNPLATRRSHEEIERDAQKIVSEIPQITGMTRVMCHFLNQQVRMP